MKTLQAFATGNYSQKSNTEMNGWLASLMQTYLIHWQFPDQEAHMKGADVFAQYVESGCESDKFEGFEVINRVVNPKGASGWAIVKASDHKAV